MSTKITIIDYGVCNVKSMANMILKTGHDAKVATKPNDIQTADRLILPGVGSFDNGVKSLKQSGFFDAIKSKMEKNPVPLLGVCLGMQILGQGSEEGRLNGFGFVNGNCQRFRFPSGSQLRVPHMGWNETEVEKTSPLFSGLEHNSRFYFAHSYHMCFGDVVEDVTIASTNHGGKITAAFQTGMIVGGQFHPEKSHRFGFQFLKNFGDWNA